jgi:hypothetical protein
VTARGGSAQNGEMKMQGYRTYLERAEMLANGEAPATAGYIAPKSPECNLINAALERLDSRIGELIQSMSSVYVITDNLCGSRALSGECSGPDNVPRVPNGIIEKIDERTDRLAELASNLARCVERLNAL